MTKPARESCRPVNDRGVIRRSGEVSLQRKARSIDADYSHVTHCVWPDCGEALDFINVGPLCVYHALLVHEAVRQSTTAPVTNAKALVAEKRQADRERREQLARTRGQLPGWIYYIRIDGKVKIGYSADVRQRMRDYPPESELLAVHPGTRDLEADMHRRFVGSRAAGREWFRETPDLTEHIGQVVAQFGDPAAHRYHFRSDRQSMRRARAS